MINNTYLELEMMEIYNTTKTYSLTIGDVTYTIISSYNHDTDHESISIIDLNDQEELSGETYDIILEKFQEQLDKETPIIKFLTNDLDKVSDNINVYDDSEVSELKDSLNNLLNKLNNEGYK